jgi:hypothetical protein
VDIADEKEISFVLHLSSNVVVVVFASSLHFLHNVAIAIWKKRSLSEKCEIFEMDINITHT